VETPENDEAPAATGAPHLTCNLNQASTPRTSDESDEIPSVEDLLEEMAEIEADNEGLEEHNQRLLEEKRRQDEKIANLRSENRRLLEENQSIRAEGSRENANALEILERRDNENQQLLHEQQRLIAAREEELARARHENETLRAGAPAKPTTKGKPQIVVQPYKAKEIVDEAERADAAARRVLAWRRDLSRSLDTRLMLGIEFGHAIRSKLHVPLRDRRQQLRELMELRVEVTQAALADIDDVMANPAPGMDGSHGPPFFHALHARYYQCICRYCPPGTPYRAEAERAVLLPIKRTNAIPTSSYQALGGIVHAMRADIAAGKLATFEERVRADVYGDLMTQAEGLHYDRFARAAAMIAGAALEEHIRKLAIKSSIAVTTSGGDPKKASVLNSDLRAAGVYSEPQRAAIEAWQKLRNEAAHGKPGFEPPNESLVGGVKPMIDAVRVFIAQYPA
jgi:hypothetical protein